MAYIATVPPGEAKGRLASIYEAALKRVGKVYNILSIQSPNPAALEASMALYTTVMHGPSPLSRVERESIAVVVSRANDCFY